MDSVTATRLDTSKMSAMIPSDAGPPGSRGLGG